MEVLTPGEHEGCERATFTEESWMIVELGGGATH